MHRSGTSLVSRLLDKSGILMGKDLQSDHESKFFIGLNKWVYENAGADWARPAAVAELVDFEPAREKVEQYLRDRVSSSASRKYSGQSHSNGLFDLDCPWGWKDPRNGPALPFWTSIWPEMRIIHVVRHGVDVAASLHTRSKRNWSEDVNRFERWLPFFGWRSNKPPIRRGQRAATLSHALDFWAEQMAIEQTVLEGRENVLTIRYEDLLTDTESTLRQILEHISVSADPELLNHLEGMVDSTRGPYAYRGDKKLPISLSRTPDLQSFGVTNPYSLGITYPQAHIQVEIRL
ncbi:MAG: hypothetical protein CM1200mP21_09390 [Candidatus Poseidoniales archaeon]|nr:MAG: hypothetical protein CM1200mP21_09390 [Candidatus Poseidoniales archaeon]